MIQQKLLDPEVLEDMVESALLSAMNIGASLSNKKIIDKTLEIGSATNWEFDEGMPFILAL